MELDRFSFLKPWTLMLPDRGAAVLAAVGSGGKTTLLRRLHEHFREKGRTVVWTSLSAHPEPVGISSEDEVGAAAAVLRDQGSVFLGGGASVEQIESLRAELRPDVVLVEAGERGEGRFDPTPGADELPETLHQLFCVGPLHAVGRPWNARHVLGAPPEAERRDGDVRRVTTDEVLSSVRGLGRSDLPPGALTVPFLTGFGEYRDMDGMFALVSGLCDMPGAKAVCLAELIGDERRDAADRAGLPEGSPALGFLEGERVYAVYPAELDGE